MLVLLGWSVTVRFNYGGNWTGLYCTGEGLSVPPALAASERIYRFPHSNGFDGQFYHYLAHDPSLRSGLWRFIDAPRYRCRRILVPGLAWMFAGGRQAWIDPAYLAVTLAFVLAGAWWLSRYATLLGRSPLWGLGFLLLPGVLVSLDRLTVDVALSALIVGALLCLERGARGGLYALLVLAALSRETGLLLIASVCCSYALERRWGSAALFGTSALPAFAWFAYEAWRLPPSASVLLSSIPFEGLVRRFAELPSYSQYGIAVRIGAHIFDIIALCGILLAIYVGCRVFVRAPRAAASVAILLFILLAAVLGSGDPWESVYSYGRTLTPLLLLIAIDGLRNRRPWALAPAAMVASCTLLQMGPQALNAARGVIRF